MTEAEKFPGSDSLEVPIILDSKIKTRSRSNSKVFGRANPLFAGASTTPPTNGRGSNGGSVKESSILPNGISHDQRHPPGAVPTSSLSDNPALSSSVDMLPPRKVPPPSRDQFAHIIVLSSTNETFDKKTLTVPQHPEALKLGRPNSSQKAPSMYNGYFDSRVISREHAELYLKDGIVYLRDCNSSNGTFVNGAKIKEHQLKEGDTVDLGIDIDTEKNKHQQHRKIACLVDNVLTIPIDGTTDLNKILDDLNRSLSGKGKGVGGTKSKSGDFAQDELNPFDAAMFGDVTRDLEDVTLGINHDFLSGIFVNNNIGTSSALVHSIRLLINQLHQEKLNNMKLDSVVHYLEKYKMEVERPGEHSLVKLKEFKDRMDEIKKKNDKHKVTILDLEAKIQEYKESLAVSESTQKDLVRQVKTLYETVNDERKKNDVHVKRIEELESNVRAKVLSIEALQSQAQSQNEVHVDKDTKISELEATIQSKDKEIENILKERDVLYKQAQGVSVASDVVFMAAITGAVVVVGAYILK